ncbi:MAG: hypothetical protein KJZ77_00160 [Anaerolineales bacterium]|nr:hypothetical protein [Anaerolineales bacterium]
MRIPFLNRIYRQVDFDRKLVFKFFTVFSLFEYALKREGFLTVGRSSEAQPDWESFANAIDPQFTALRKPSLISAKNYMLNHPVMRQIVHNNVVTYTRRIKPNNMNDIVWLSILIRGVRNNLFHGGKFRYDRPRDPDLIKSSLIILEAWAKLHPDVKQALENIR